MATTPQHTKHKATLQALEEHIQLHTGDASAAPLHCRAQAPQCLQGK